MINSYTDFTKETAALLMTINETTSSAEKKRAAAESLRSKVQAMPSEDAPYFPLDLLAETYRNADNSLRPILATLAQPLAVYAGSLFDQGNEAGTALRQLLKEMTLGGDSKAAFDTVTTLFQKGASPSELIPTLDGALATKDPDAIADAGRTACAILTKRPGDLVMQDCVAAFSRQKTDPQTATLAKNALTFAHAYNLG